ncbi:MAG: dihydrofolate reductase family protein [Xanthomonadaceae bacterium]|nr:dihydrofolate reductase family protein [Xanthomonadaceae bacterium]
MSVESKGNTNQRPHIICHMETSINGKSMGPFMGMPQRAALARAYDETFLSLGSQAWLCGRVTMAHFAGSGEPVFDAEAPRVPREDFVADTAARDFVVAVDPSGKLPWRQNSVRFHLRPRAHLIEVLTDRASDDYVAYLNQRGISYVFAGSDVLDLPLAARKLHDLFGIQVLTVSGGPTINGSFLHAGLIDEISLVMAPLMDDATDTPTAFLRAPDLPSQPPRQYELKSAQALPNDILWVRYGANS